MWGVTRQLNRLLEALSVENEIHRINDTEN